MEHDTLPEVIETARLRLRPWELTAMADVDNTASQRVMEKVGMRKEGVLRQNRVERGEVIDEAWYGILRDEWLERTEGLATPPPNGS